VHNLFLVYLSISTCFQQLCAHHQEKQLCGWLSGMHTTQSSTKNNKYQALHKHSCFSWWWAHSRPKHVKIDKYNKNKLCTKLALFTRTFAPLSPTLLFLQACPFNFYSGTHSSFLFYNNSGQHHYKHVVNWRLLRFIAFFDADTNRSFDVFLTEHHSINLFNYQLDAQFLYSVIYVLH
jgi:hypothetical protein